MLSYSSPNPDLVCSNVSLHLSDLDLKVFFFSILISWLIYFKPPFYKIIPIKFMKPENLTVKWLHIYDSLKLF